MDVPTLDTLRQRFFIEAWQPQAFVDRTWRGGAVNGDDHRLRMPREMFEALVKATGATHLYVAMDMGPPHVEIPATWSALEAHLLHPSHHAIDRLIYDDSGDWAILMDFDVTTLGASRPIAEKIDELLGKSGVSLASLTLGAFEGLEDDPRVRSILGSEV
jgi:hypothetical protein